MTTTRTRENDDVAVLELQHVWRGAGFVVVLDNIRGQQLASPSTSVFPMNLSTMATCARWRRWRALGRGARSAGARRRGGNLERGARHVDPQLVREPGVLEDVVEERRDDVRDRDQRDERRAAG